MSTSAGPEDGIPAVLQRLHIHNSEAAMKQRAVYAMLSAPGVCLQLEGACPQGARVEFEGMDELPAPTPDSYSTLLQELEKEEQPRRASCSKTAIKSQIDDRTHHSIHIRQAQAVALGLASQVKGPIYEKMPWERAASKETILLSIAFLLLVACLTTNLYFNP
mmetsp:Transcript_37861/g.52576  ORF Transcript_37861/g.52576 Transcript_37861/m.52576 type:complete len:163 (+) Transcript_37861:130-618(+)